MFILLTDIRYYQSSSCDKLIPIPQEKKQQLFFKLALFG